MMELLGRMPKNLAFSGKNSKAFFDRSGHLKKIRGLNFWPLKKVLMEKYRIKEKEAQGLSDFLIPMLSWYPTERATAQDMLSHYWLTSDSEEDVKMNEAEYKEYMMQQKI
jgi:serine/threonine-protein kinase SRPK3